MARARRGFKARQRRNKILKLARGYHFDRRRKYRHTLATVIRALHNAYKTRRLLKRSMRRLWVVRISAAAKMMGGSYSKFMGRLKKANVVLNRKMLADLAARDVAAFKAVYDRVASL